MTEQDTRSTDHMISRRSVMQVLTALAGTGAFSAAAAGGQEQQEEEAEEADEAEENSDYPVGTEALLDYIAAKYGDILSEADIESLEEDVAGNIETAQAMDEYDLENGDDMALVFEAYRGSY